MKITKGLIITIIIALIFIGGCSTLTGKYNSMVSKQEDVKKAWGQVENVYQRRADLIPNLVNIVKGSADFEKSTLTAVIEARAKATQVSIKPGADLSPEKMQQFISAQDGLSSSLSRLMVVVEKYPDLKSTQGFLQLQDQLEGTENRISVERRRFNEAAQVYNTYIKTFPNNIISGMFSFEPKPYFEADKGANKSPEVKF